MNSPPPRKLRITRYILQAQEQKKKGDIDKAISTYHKSIKNYPSSSWSYHYLGIILFKKGDFEAAIACYENAIRYNPSVSENYNKLGELYFKQRQLKRAVDCFNKAISLHPNSAWSYQNLGESFAQQHRWRQSVDCYRHALKLNPGEVFKYHNYLKIKPDNTDDIKVSNPVFIVGCGHSGTSIMLALLSNHSAFYPITYESALFQRSESEIRKIMQQWDRECIEAGNKRWIEKTPPHIFHIKKFLLHRPQSKFILMLRDGRDVVCSLKHRTNYNSFEERLERWIYDNMAGLPYWKHSNIMVVKYEDLIEKTTKTLKDIFDFLGEQYTEQVLKYHQQEKCWYHTKIIKPENVLTQDEHHQLRNWQINQPLYDGRGRWLKEMLVEEKHLFKQLAQQYLEQFGYVADDCW